MQYKLTDGEVPENEPATTHDKHQSLLQAIDGIVWEADAQTFEFIYVSDKVTDILGYTPQQWLSTPGFWKDHIYCDDRELAIGLLGMPTTAAQHHSFDFRMIKSDGNIIWLRNIVSVIGGDDRPGCLVGIMFDITESKLLEDLDHLEKHVLGLSSQKNVSIAAVLHVYMQGMEHLFPQMKCSIHSVRDNRLYDLSSLSLPAAYVAAIDGKEIGPLAGSCGTAAFLKQQVIVTDIENDEHWAAYKHLALQYDLRACWSYPIIDSEGNAIAVFGIYYDKVKTPGEAELSIIERSAAILKMILENKLYEETIVEMNMMISQGQALANFGTWQWDINNNQVTWSDELFNIYGQNKQGFKATFEGYVERLHPLDRERVQGIITNALSAKKDFTFEERVVRPGGEIRHLKSWGRVMVSETGKPIKMIGACLDITQAKTTETKMEEIAWLQSHVIRAPLARLMGLAGMLHDELKLNGEQLELLDNIVDAAHELDKVIRNITTKTYM